MCGFDKLPLNTLFMTEYDNYCKKLLRRGAAFIALTGVTRGQTMVGEGGSVIFVEA